jgi:methenyltetrahydromethanopterin cyclohydrolase
VVFADVLGIDRRRIDGKRSFAHGSPFVERDQKPVVAPDTVRAGDLVDPSSRRATTTVAFYSLAAQGFGMESLNGTALDLVDEAIDFADELGVAVHHLEDDAVVIDFGVDAEGGVEAGLLLSEIVTGGLATVQTRLGTVAGTPLTHVELATDHPRLALLRSAMADWQPAFTDAVGSGPARLLAEDGPHETDHCEEFDFAVLALEADRLPGEPVAGDVASRCGVPTSGVFLPTAPVASVAGGVSMAARAAEVAVLRLAHLGYDTAQVVSATGSAPVPPAAGDRETALVRANDAIAHGGGVHLVVETAFDRFDEVPFGATEFGGASMERVFADAGWNLQEVPPEAFAPAQVTVDVRGGGTYGVGQRDEDRLAAVLGVS